MLAILGAVLAGGAATLLKPDRAPGGSPGNLQIPATSKQPVDLQAIQRELLEQLILDAVVHRDPSKLPALTTFTSFVSHRPDDFGWVLERMQADDVTPALLIAFVGKLPRGRERPDRLADRLLGPLLQGPMARPALNALRSRGRVRFVASPACGCGFGIHPSEPRPEDPITAVAFGVDDAVTLSWGPRQVDGDWQLDLRREPAGQNVLARPLPSAPSVRVIGHASPSEEVVVTVSERR